MMFRLLHEAVASHASQRPEATAVLDGDRQITYQELELASNRLTRCLVEQGVSPGDRVCFAIPKSIDAIIAVIAILKSGAIYTPLDTSSPPARLARIVDSCEPTVILTLSEHLSVLEATLAESEASPRSIGVLDQETPELQGSSEMFGSSSVAAASDAQLDLDISDDQTAYILFTSGSTGIPKGVPISHSNVSTFVNWANGYFGTGPDDRVSGHTSLHFDLSVYDLFGALFAGAELHLVPREALLLPNKTANFIRDSKLTQWFSVPSALNYMYRFDVIAEGDFPDLKRILWCGEVLPTPALIYLMERLPHVSFTNLYGPTEATIASSFYTVPEVPEAPSSPISIGEACGGEFLAILNDELNEVPQGETGDLYIGGDGLSTGYWKDDVKTAEAFIDAELNGRTQRIYKTGDLAYKGEGGLVYFVGRSDTQIKSRGYRIELGEIETALSSIEQLVESAVVAIESDGFEGSVICCAYACGPNGDIAPAEIRDNLLRLVPDYMVPARWNKYDALPKNSSGKIDRVALKKYFESESTGN